MNALDSLCDDLWYASFRTGAYDAGLIDDERRGIAEYQAQQHYESSVIEQARAIVDGEHSGPPTVEHLRVLLAWLDGALPRSSNTLDESPF